MLTLSELPWSGSHHCGPCPAQNSLDEPLNRSSCDGLFLTPRGYPAGQPQGMPSSCQSLALAGQQTRCLLTALLQHGSNVLEGWKEGSITISHHFSGFCVCVPAQWKGSCHYLCLRVLLWLLHLLYLPSLFTFHFASHLQGGLSCHPFSLLCFLTMMHFYQFFSLFFWP